MYCAVYGDPIERSVAGGENVTVHSDYSMAVVVFAISSIWSVSLDCLEEMIDSNTELHSSHYVFVRTHSYKYKRIQGDTIIVSLLLLFVLFHSFFSCYSTTVTSSHFLSLTVIPSRSFILTLIYLSLSVSIISTFSVTLTHDYLHLL